MESHAKRSGRQRNQIADARRRGPKPEGEVAQSALVVTDVVRHGTGRGSRIDLTVVSSRHRVRLTGLAAKHVLNYRRIEESAIEEGVVLPYLRSAHRVWREVLATAMEGARVEPWLEGEEIADAIAAEIRALLEDCHRGEGASDLAEGKVVKQGDRLLVSPRALVRVVRSRLVDDVLPQATIAEAAAAHLGMRQLRPRFVDVRPRAWAFPLPLASARENREVGELRLDEGASSKPGEEKEVLGDAQEWSERGAGAGEANRIRSTDRGASVASPLPTEKYELDPLDREKKRFHAGPAGGGRVLGHLSPMDHEMPAGSNGRQKNVG